MLILYDNYIEYLDLSFNLKLENINVKSKYLKKIVLPSNNKEVLLSRLFDLSLYDVYDENNIKINSRKIVMKGQMLIAKENGE